MAYLYITPHEIETMVHFTREGEWDMRTSYGLTILLLLLVIAIPVCADTAVPSTVTMTMSKYPILVANGMDSIKVTITVKDAFNSTISDLPVDYVIDNPSLGTFSPGSINTSASGVAESVFKTNQIPGEVRLNVRIQYIENETPHYRNFPEGGDYWSIFLQDPIPDNITFSSTEDWLIANGADFCFARVTTYNQSYPIPNLEVSFQVLEPEMGAFQPTKTVTDVNGLAQSQFTAKYKSGNATLKAFINYEFFGNETIVERQYIQKIDHDTPYALSRYIVPSEVSVGSSTPLTMAYSDRWGNPIDNRRYVENVTFMVSSPENDAFFLNNNSSVVIVPVNLFGEAIGILKASISPAINVVRVDPDMGSIPDNYYFIQAIANRTPVKIEQLFEPEGIQGRPPKVYSDGIMQFAITYTVTDEFSNGVMNSPVWIRTFEVGTGEQVEERTVYTNSFGQALITYGPKTTIGKYNIVAQAIGNTTSPPTCSKEVWFVSQEAEDLQFTAVPDSMASRDVDGWQPAMLMAKVIDDNGNPVEGETVTFSLGTPVYEATPYPPVVTMGPEIVNTTAVTDSDGFAIVDFNPGAFTLNWTDPFYDDTASGRCTAYAHWENTTSGKSITQNLDLTWKNYPYLSIETQVYPQTVNVTGTVNVKISLKGDGWALRPKPIDAVFCTDRSGSMLEDNPDRMVSVMGASKAFVAAMHVGPARDHIGLVSFGTNGRAKLAPVYRSLNGWYYCYRSGSGWNNRYLSGWFYDWTNMYGVTSDSNSISSSSFRWVYRDDYWDMPTTYNYQNYWPYTENYDTGSNHQIYMNTNYPGDNRNYGNYAVIENSLSADPNLINASINMMVPSGGTPMRYGLYRAIQEIIANGRTNAIRAIILLSDGDYNYYGDPLARGTGYDSCNPTNYGNLATGYCKFSDLGSGINSNQNMSNYAKNNNIRIYSIGFAQDISTGGRNTLRILAESTGGQYYDGDAANIDEIYTAIAGQLQEEAGVDTTMDMGYDQIEVNYDIVAVNETYKVFGYVPSTNIDSYDLNMTRPVHDPAYPYTIDQSEEFNQSHKLNFNVGTVKLGQTWEAVYSLQVLVDGTINVFGENSFVYFNGTQGPSQLRLPKTYITGVANMTSEGVNSSTLEITVGDSSEGETNIITWPIYRSYSGSMGFREDYYISIDGGMTWILVGFYNVPESEWNKPGSYSVNRNQFPSGSVLTFRVVANALDAPGPIIAIPQNPAPPPPSSRTAYIILK